MTKTLNPVHPNVGLEVDYRDRLEKLVDALHRSVVWWVTSAYRKNEPATIAMDDSSTAAISLVIKRITKYWMRRIKATAPELAKYFAKKSTQRADGNLEQILRDGGFAIQFKLTAAANEVLQSTIKQNVALITNMTQQHLAEIEGMVMRSVQTGRDIGTLAKELEARYAMTKRRARLIARDQNNKATASIVRVRQTEIGVEQAKWLHSHAGKTPRPTHVAMHGKLYSVKKGMWDPDAEGKGKGAYIYPGMLINCFPGSTQVQFADGVEKAYRRWYSGELSELVTSSGKTLNATPNHPVLTPDGWKAVGSLDEGDYVIEVAEECLSSIPSEDDVDHAVPRIGDIFVALGKSGFLKPEVSLAGQFHGDGSADGNVYVVDAARPLSFGIEFGLLQRHYKFGFADTAQAALSLGFIGEFFKRAFAASARFVGGRGEAFPSRQSFALHAYGVGLAGAAEGPAGFGDIGSDGSVVPSVPVRNREFEDAPAPFIFPTQKSRVVSNSRSFFDGHVFNLQTVGGWYVADGIITHNCRCVSRAVLPALGPR